MNHVKNESGFTLIELLVSMAILAFIVASVMGAFSAQDSAYRVSDQVIGMQRDLRLISDNIMNDMSDAGGGFYGLYSYGKDGSGNCIQQYGMPMKVGSTGFCTKYNRGVFPMSFTASSTTYNAVMTAGVNAYKMFMLSADTVSQTTQTNAPSSYTFVYSCVAGNYVFKTTDYVVVSNYNHTGVFQVTAASVSPSGSYSSTTGLCTAAGTVTITATDYLGYDSVSMAGKDAAGSDATYYVSYRYDAFKSYIGAYRNILYAYSSPNLYRGEDFLGSGNLQFMSQNVPKLSWEEGYSTKASEPFPFFPHKVDNYYANLDQCTTDATTFDQNNRLVTMRVHVLARSEKTIPGDSQKMSESMAYQAGIGYTFETTGATGTATSLSTTANSLYYHRMSSFQVDLKNMYGIDYGDNNDYLASLKCR